MRNSGKPEFRCNPSFFARRWMRGSLARSRASLTRFCPPMTAQRLFSDGANSFHCLAPPLRRHFTPSLPGLTRQSILLCKKMDARVTSAFTRVFDALLPAHPREVATCEASALVQDGRLEAVDGVRE